MRDPCGPNAYGVPGDPIHHVCNCACIDGYEGNPKVRLIPYLNLRFIPYLNFTFSPLCISIKP